jgi:hypothetical protein
MGQPLIDAQQQLDARNTWLPMALSRRLRQAARLGARRCVREVRVRGFHRAECGGSPCYLGTRDRKLN